MVSLLVRKKRQRRVPSGKRHGQSPGFQRRQARADLLELLALMVGPLPHGSARAMSPARRHDTGLFGPSSVTWQMAREPLLLLGGGRALLMQVAHPLVGQGVIEHSDFESRPFGRLLGTIRWLFVEVIFGDTASAQAAARRLQTIHERVRGRLGFENATPQFAAGVAYAGADPVLSRWVLATIVESMLVTYQALIGPISTAESDRAVQEWARVGELMGIAPEALWGTAAELHQYVCDEIASERVRPVPASTVIAPTVLEPPLPWPGLGPATAGMRLLTTGLLPAPLRRGYGLHWAPFDGSLYACACAISRRLHPYLPLRLRVSPLYDTALRASARPGIGP